jgi:hypothetical protein
LRSGRSHGAAALLAVFGVALLASCSWIPFVGKKQAEKPAGPTCPITVILHPLANTAVFAPNIAPGDLKPLNVAERGSAAHSNDVDLNYFISLTGPNQAIFGKKSFSVHITVPDKAKRGGVSDHVEVAFSTGGQPLSNLNLTVGFQESPQAIEFYKNFRGR